MNKDLEIDSILLDLKIISQIKENDKLITSKDLLEIDNSYFQSIKRYWNNDNRLSTIDYIKNVVNNTLKFTDITFNDSNNNTNIFKENNSHILQRFLVEMTNAIKGLDNLKLTYNNDTTIISAIDIYKEKLTMRIEAIQNILTINVNKEKVSKNKELKLNE